MSDKNNVTIRMSGHSVAGTGFQRPGGRIAARFMILRRLIGSGAPAIPYRLLLCAGAVALLLLFMPGCGGSANQPDAEGNYAFRIQLSTTSGTQTFSGTIIATKADGRIEITHVEGTAPTSYNTRGVQMDLTFSKATAAGHLKVVLLKGGTTLAEGETSAAFGTVAVSGR